MLVTAVHGSRIILLSLRFGLVVSMNRADIAVATVSGSGQQSRAGRRSINKKECEQTDRRGTALRG